MVKTRKIKTQNKIQLKINIIIRYIVKPYKHNLLTGKKILNENCSTKKKTNRIFKNLPNTSSFINYVYKKCRKKLIIYVYCFIISFWLQKYLLLLHLNCKNVKFSILLVFKDLIVKHQYEFHLCGIEYQKITR